MRQRATLLRILTALVGIVAFGLAAATLPEVVDVGTEGFGNGPGGDGDGSQEPAEPAPEGADQGQESAPWFFQYLLLALLVLAAGVLAWYAVFERRELAKLVAVCAAVTAFVLFMVTIFDEDAAAILVEAFEVGPVEEAEEPGGDGGLPGSNGEQPSTFELLALATAAVATIFAAGVLFSRGAGASAPDPDATADEEPEDATEMGAVAGRTADRIESGTDGASLENEVYRAWIEMTRLLDVERPETSTPGEFAEAAVDVGLDRQHVDDLTDLFEEVRYGGAETTAEREDRAVETLRRIEATYVDDGEDAVGVGDRG